VAHLVFRDRSSHIYPPYKGNFCLTLLSLRLTLLADSEVPSVACFFETSKKICRSAEECRANIFVALVSVVRAAVCFLDSLSGLDLEKPDDERRVGPFA
jgi:hypothetical protein